MIFIQCDIVSDWLGTRDTNRNAPDPIQGVMIRGREGKGKRY